MQNDTEIKNTIKVLIADDHALIRQFLRSVLEQEEDITVIGEATDGEETLSLVRSLDVNIVIIDIAMPKFNGIEATRIIKKEFPDIHILVLTIYDDSEHILSILEAGASGYLTKNIIGETIPRTIRALYNGESVLTEDVMKKLLGYAVRYPSKAIDLKDGDILSIREMEILQLLSKGYGNQAIAQELSLSLNTVKRYMANIFDKLKANSRTEAVINAQRAGIIHIADVN